MRHVCYLLVLLLAASCSKSSETPQDITLDAIAESYVKLSLAVGAYDDDYIDAYYGPQEWQDAVENSEPLESFPYDEFIWKASKLLHLLEDFDQANLDELGKLRHHFLVKQLIAAKTKISMIAGKVFPFDKESEALYDAVSPSHDQSYYEELFSQLDEIIPGEGPIQERYAAFSRSFVIPPDKLDTVFKVAIAEAKKRTIKYLELPADENFKLEYVTDKSWSGYNLYQGNFFSLIQINTDLPINIDRAVDLASHEGYPGHHVYNVLLEKNLVTEKGWKEFSVYPLFSPQSLIAEGSANFGIKVAFPGEERLDFEKSVLYPLAGLDPSMAEQYQRALDIKEQLSYAGNEAARKYLNGEISREAAAEWLMRYNLFTMERAIQRTRFIDQYRSYVINYNLGKDLVKEYVISQGGTDDNQDLRWQIFGELLSTPQTASLLK